MSEERQPTDRIHIEGLEVWARVGVPEEERGTRQRLEFNITIWPIELMTTLQDDLTRTIDYAAVATETKQFVEARSDRLIETLAETVANQLLAMFPISKVTVELRKFILPNTKFVSVTVTRWK